MKPKTRNKETKKGETKRARAPVLQSYEKKRDGRGRAYAGARFARDEAEERRRARVVLDRETPARDNRGAQTAGAAALKRKSTAPYAPLAVFYRRLLERFLYEPRDRFAARLLDERLLRLLRLMRLLTL